MQCHNQYRWVRVDVSVLGPDIIIKLQKLGQSLALEAGMVKRSEI